MTTCAIDLPNRNEIQFSLRSICRGARQGRKWVCVALDSSLAMTSGIARDPEPWTGLIFLGVGGEFDFLLQAWEVELWPLLGKRNRKLPRDNDF
jgi:hypothetical protein